MTGEEVVEMTGEEVVDDDKSNGRDNKGKAIELSFAFKAMPDS